MVDETNVRTIREMCEAFGVTARSLRFYEQKGLLSPRRFGQRRLYTRRESVRLKLILLGKHFGLSLDEIRNLLDLYSPADGGLAQLRGACDAARRRLREMEEERRALDGKIRECQDRLVQGETRINRITARMAAE